MTTRGGPSLDLERSIGVAKSVSAKPGQPSSLSVTLQSPPSIGWVDETTSQGVEHVFTLPFQSVEESQDLRQDEDVPFTLLTLEVHDF